MFKVIESTADGKCEEAGMMLDEIAREGARLVAVFRLPGL